MAFNNRNKRAINPDLASERKTSTFDVKELTTLLDGTEDDTKERHEIEQFFARDPNIPDPFHLLNLNHDEYYKESLKAALYVEDIIAKKDFSGQQLGKTQHVRAFHSRLIYSPSESPNAVHTILFLPTIMAQGTEEQLDEWEPLVREGKIIGTYAQTELGHGSNLQQLETTATYDPQTEEFILNTPTITSIKCWASGLGRTSTHALVMAQLYINGKCFGLHMFIVQIRCLKDHSSLSGVTVGELGPKMGMHGTDNGFLHMNNVRIPRKNMLRKHANVLKDGSYVKPEHSRASYGMMIFVRTMIVEQAAMTLAQACTISVRYNAVRRQGKIENNGADVKILDYQTQQYKLFPQVALAYAIHFSFKRLLNMYLETIASGSAEEISEFHPLAAGMKAVATHLGSVGTEICRQACGGFGFLQASHLPGLCTHLLASCTYEGDNTILRLQTARYLIKSANMLAEGKLIGKSVKYLNITNDDSQVTCMTEFMQLFQFAAANLIKDVANQLKREVEMGKKHEFAWHDHTVELTKCALFHVQAFVIQSLHELFKTTQMSTSLHQVMGNLFQLLALYWIQENSGDFITHGQRSAKAIKEMTSRIPNLLKLLRPDIVGLVDAFDFCDAALQSPIGSYDGRAYERLFEYWSKLPANKLQGKQKSKL